MLGLFIEADRMLAILRSCGVRNGQCEEQWSIYSYTLHYTTEL